MTTMDRIRQQSLQLYARDLRIGYYVQIVGSEAEVVALRRFDDTLYVGLAGHPPLQLHVDDPVWVKAEEHQF